MTHPYAVPNRLSPDLVRVQAYWRGLLRGNAEVPFWDDAKLSDLPDLTDCMVLIDVFDRPQRFRFNLVGKALDNGDLAGRFLDEVAPDGPFEFLGSQCGATVEGAHPTCFRRERGAPAGSSPYARLLLPMWGDGRISMLMGVVDAD
jgi:hypothetical protein